MVPCVFPGNDCFGVMINLLTHFNLHSCGSVNDLGLFFYVFEDGISCQGLL